ncbi:transcriptional regulator, TetR family [Oscillospiraceae bacterium]|nr:transcriptional regulator, TetR family [Oscillospiraceae bacterium]
MAKAADREKLRKDIILSTIEVFNDRGVIFTMSDVATNIHISKKTIYKEFDSKEELLDTVVDYIFDNIKAKEDEIMHDKSLSTIDRLRLILGAMPENYRDIDFQNVYPFLEKFPEVSRKMQYRLATGWENTISLIEQGKKEGVIRKNIDIRFVKVMLEASIEKVLSDDMLSRTGINYVDALNQIVDILVDGMIIK